MDGPSSRRVDVADPLIRRAVKGSTRSGRGARREDDARAARGDRAVVSAFFSPLTATNRIALPERLQTTSQRRAQPLLHTSVPPVGGGGDPSSMPILGRVFLVFSRPL